MSLRPCASALFSAGDDLDLGEGVGERQRIAAGAVTAPPDLEMSSRTQRCWSLRQSSSLPPAPGAAMAKTTGPFVGLVKVPARTATPPSVWVKVPVLQVTAPANSGAVNEGNIRRVWPGSQPRTGSSFWSSEALFFGLDVELGQKTRHLLHGHPVAALTRRRLELDPTRFDTETPR